jgi:chromosome segregation ATPase
MKRMALLSILALLFSYGCSPLRSSPYDEKHQLELTLHEVQTNLDDLRHDIHCFQTDIQILEGRIKHYENLVATLKPSDQEKSKLDQLLHQVQALEKKWAFLEKAQSKDLQNLQMHANETTASLTQFKDRIQELEGILLSQNRRVDELTKGKQKGDSPNGFQLYKVRSGDSLEKIAKAHKTAVEKIKKLNNLGQDLIVVGQELKIPVESE